MSGSRRTEAAPERDAVDHGGQLARLNRPNFSCGREGCVRSVAEFGVGAAREQEGQAIDPVGVGFGGVVTGHRVRFLG